ncbi:DUF6597 domain-containing transcriptional factor [Nocardia sp. CNY236]|uniref:DUF6597 domain-containing transcriptional factor n=1 Tax=Nocardia sp. CNY236 TaxID=1169152 RepID=UPI00048CEEE5|nr:DUF6597 domain-containing transcriptional factor [Nocardia sp. CNY236]
MQTVVAGGYQERPSRYDGAVLWTRVASDSRRPTSPVLPDGCIDLFWATGRLIVAGPATRAYQASEPEGSRYVGVRFSPGTAPAVLGVPAHELRDQRVDLAQLWPSSTVQALAARLAAADDRVAVLEGIVLRRAAGAGPIDPMVRRVVTALEAGRSVGAAAEATGLGARTLHRRSLVAFGYGPKTLARVLRLQRAVASARRGVAFADIAALDGFADQAHLSREVRALAGMSLAELLTRS